MLSLDLDQMKRQDFHSPETRNTETSMEPPQHPSQPKTTPQNDNVSDHIELPTDPFEYVHEEPMPQQTIPTDDFRRKLRLLQQNKTVKEELRALEEAERFLSMSSFLHRQEKSFLTPWSLNDPDGYYCGNYFRDTDGVERMYIEDGSFFSTNVLFARPKKSKKGRSRFKPTNSSFLKRYR